jgi:hypothetical protein
LDVSFQATGAQDVRTLSCPEFSEFVCADLDVPDHVRTSTFTAARWQVGASIGLGKGFSISAGLPVVLKVFDVAHTLPDGSAYTIPYSLLSGVSGPVFGLGDATVKGRLTGPVRGTPILLDVGVGVHLPTGRTSPDPFDPALPASQRQPRQFGNGTVDPRIELGLVVRGKPIGLVVQGSSRIPLYANVHGYQGQWQLSGSIGAIAAMPEPIKTLSLMLMLDLSHSAAARWNGAEAVNSGGNTAAIRMGFEWAITPEFAVRGQLTASPLQIMNGDQFTAPVAAGLGVSGTVDLRKKEARHAH